jgi:hypothetical protein
LCPERRNGNNNKPYYINLCDFGANLTEGVLYPAEYTVNEELEISSIHSCLDYYIGYEKGDILFLSSSYIQANNNEKYKGYKASYSKINKSSVNTSPIINKDLYGMVKIVNILKYKVKDDYRYYFVCQPIASPFTNFPMGHDLFVDVDAARGSDYISTSVDYPNAFTQFLVKCANEYEANNPPNEFYNDCLKMFFGQNEINSMDEFKKNELLSTGKKVMDGIYSLRNVVFEHSYKSICFSYLSDYDFSNKCFHIRELKKVEPMKNFEVGPYSFGLYTSMTTSLTRNIYFSRNTIYDDRFNISPEKAKELVALLKQNNLKRYGDNAYKFVVLVPHYRYVPKSSYNSADSIDVYSDITLMNKLQTIYPIKNQ